MTKLKELQQQAAENLKIFDQVEVEKDTTEQDAQFIPTNVNRCEQLLELLDRGKRVSIQAISRAIGSDYQADLTYLLSGNEWLMTLDEKAKEALKDYNVKIQTFHIRYRKAYLKNPRMSLPKTLQSSFDQRMGHLEERILEEPWLEGALSINSDEADIESLPRRIDFALSAVTVKRHILQHVLAAEQAKTA